MKETRYKRTLTKRNKQKATETNRNQHIRNKKDKIGQKQIVTDVKRQTWRENDRNGEKEIKMY